MTPPHFLRGGHRRQWWRAIRVRKHGLVTAAATPVALKQARGDRKVGRLDGATWLTSFAHVNRCTASDSITRVYRGCDLGESAPFEASIRAVGARLRGSWIRLATACRWPNTHRLGQLALRPRRQQMLTISALMVSVVLWTSRRVHASTVSRTRTCFTHYDITGEPSRPTIPW